MATPTMAPLGMASLPTPTFSMATLTSCPPPPARRRRWAWCRRTRTTGASTSSRTSSASCCRPARAPARAPARGPARARTVHAHALCMRMCCPVRTAARARHVPCIPRTLRTTSHDLHASRPHLARARPPGAGARLPVRHGALPRPHAHSRPAPAAARPAHTEPCGGVERSAAVAAALRLCRDLLARGQLHGLGRQE